MRAIGKNDELEKLLPPEQKLGGLDVGPVEDMTPFFNMIIYGESGIGKTWLSGSAAVVAEMSPVLFIDIEGGTLTLRNSFPQVERVRVKSMEDMQEALEVLHSGKHKYKTVVLDSLTEIQKFAMDNIMRQVIEEDEERDPDIPSIREWGKSTAQMRRLIRYFRDLPMNVIFTALANLDKNPKSGLVEARPSLPGKLQHEVAGFVDIVGYYYMKEVDGELSRLLLTQKTDTEVAKDRTGRLDPVIQDPDMQMLYDMAFKSQEG